MWIPKNPPGGLPVKIAAGVGSIALVHAVFIAGHHILDETSPLDRFWYPVDRAVEAMELQWAKLWGKEASVEAKMHSATERIEEVEAVVSVFDEHSDFEATIALIRKLFSASLEQIEKALSIATSESKQHADDIHGFATAIFVESSLQNIIVRTENLQLLSSEHELPDTLTEDFLKTLRAHLQTSADVVSTFTVEDGLQLSVRDQIRRRIQHTNTSDQDGESPLSCASNGDACEVTSDCCSGLGLSCMPFQSSTGFTRRCQRQMYRICEVMCDESDVSVWSAPRRCKAGYIEKGMQPCVMFTQKQCRRERQEIVSCFEEQQ